MRRVLATLLLVTILVPATLWPAAAQSDAEVEAAAD